MGPDYPSIHSLTTLGVFLIALNFISILISIVSTWNYFRSRMILDKFLVGRWEGTIFNADTKIKLSHCMLVVTESPNQPNKGILYYEHREGNIVQLRGMDELFDYSSQNFFFFRRKLDAHFMRQFHVDYCENGWNSEENVVYKWDCRIKSLYSRPKIQVTVKGNNSCFSGTFKKT